MYSKIALFAAAAMATFVSAVPTPGSQYSQCDTGSAQCCMSFFLFFLKLHNLLNLVYKGNDTQSSTSASGDKLLSLLGIVGVVDGLIGVTCTPIVGGNSW